MFVKKFIDVVISIVKQKLILTRKKKRKRRIKTKTLRVLYFRE